MKTINHPPVSRRDFCQLLLLASAIPVIGYAKDMPPSVDIRSLLLNKTVGGVVLIPAGVGHKQLAATDDFEVLGAYPQGLSPDLYHDDPTKLSEAQEHISQIAMPSTDPVTGARGGIKQQWSKSQSPKI